MKIFTIEQETNNITVHATAKEAEAVANAERFRNEEGLAKLAVSWPAFRLVEIWNSLPGVSPVKKFKDRQTAVSRIWKAIQSLGQAAAPDEPAPVPEAATSTHIAPQTTDVASEEAPSTKKTKARKNAPKAPNGVNSQEATGPREGSKTAQVVAMLQRQGGATISEIMSSMAWQKHTVRGFMAGALKKAGFTVESFKPEGGERTYRINQ